MVSNVKRCYRLVGEWLNATEEQEYEARERLLDSIDALAADLAEAQAERDRLAKDAERFDWFFGPADKSKFMGSYVEGIRADFTPDHWRETIDDFMRQEKRDG